RTKATSRVGHTLAEKICVAAGILGSCLTKQFKAARKSGRIRRRFRFNSPSGASSCTERRVSDPCWIPFSESAIPRSQRSGAMSKNLSDSKSTRRIWQKRIGELPRVAGLDLESKIHFSSIDSTALATSSVLMAFMQRKSIGQSRRKQGL